MANYGFVYLLSNDAMPGIYKVGYTMNSPLRRAYDLSNSTSCALPYEVVCYAEVEDPRSVEADMHDRFENFRVNSKREFFRFTIEDLITYACYSICEPAESGAIHVVTTNKYDYFAALFYARDELALSPDEIIK